MESKMRDEVCSWMPYCHCRLRQRIYSNASGLKVRRSLAFISHMEAAYVKQSLRRQRSLGNSKHVCYIPQLNSNAWVPLHILAFTKKKDVKLECPPELTSWSQEVDSSRRTPGRRCVLTSKRSISRQRSEALFLGTFFALMLKSKVKLLRVQSDNPTLYTLRGLS